jgi:hypothetical protein
MSKNKQNKNKQSKTNEVDNPLTFTIIKNNWKDLKFLTIIGGIIFLSFFIYSQGINYEYVLDDEMMIKENKFTNEGYGGIFKHLTNESMTGYFGEQKNLLPGNRFRPLSLVTFSIEKGIMGKLSPELGHFNNILLYAATGILIFILFRTLLAFGKTSFEENKDLKEYILPGLIAILFIAHPLHVEAVANIKGRDEIMAMLFSLTSLYLYLKYITDNQKKYVIFGAISYFLALLSKENAITWLLVIPMTIYFFVGKDYWKPLKSLGITTLIYLIWRFTVSGVPKLGDSSNDIMNNPFLEMNFVEKYATIFYTLLKYVQLLIFPNPLTHDYYPYAIPKMDLGNWQVWVSIVFYAFILWIGLKLLKSKNLVSYSLLFYLVTLSIVSNIVINLGTFMNDRFVYMPSLGYCVLIAVGIYFVSKKISFIKSTTSIYVLGALVVLPYLWKSYHRVPAWENSLTLNKSAFPASKNSARANSFMATAIYEDYKVNTGNTDSKLILLAAAKPYALKAIEILPNYHNGNLMLAGIAGERYRFDRNLQTLLDDFYIIASNRPDIDYQVDGNGKPTSFVTQYLSYINSAESGNPILKAFYLKLLNTMNMSNKPKVREWKNAIADLALQGFSGDIDVLKIANTVKGIHLQRQ